MTYAEAVAHLGQARRFGMKLGLDAMRTLARELGDPQRGLRFIHLAGTNGKGSTAAFCEAGLRVEFQRIGLYTSPHLVSVRERIQINREPIAEEAFATGMARVKAAADEHGLEPTFFELLTALALDHFARQEVEWVIWETGLGGRLDATNIVDSEMVIITNIGLDHTAYLGTTLQEIAGEKAGIIKPGRPGPVVSAVMPGPAREVIAARARELNCDLTLLEPDRDFRDLGLRDGQQWARVGDGDYALGLLGSHQVENAACAVTALRRLKIGNGPALAESAISLGLKNVAWPGRFEVLSERPIIVLDGAHNLPALEKLARTWRAFLESRGKGKARTRLVFGAVSDKDAAAMARVLRPLADSVWLVRLANERSADPRELAVHFDGFPTSIYSSVDELWQALSRDASASPTLITGSLFLAGEVLALRQGLTGEIRLNERLEASSSAVP